MCKFRISKPLDSEDSNESTPESAVNRYFLPLESINFVKTEVKFSAEVSFFSSRISQELSPS
jgi:hypothetical protein